MFDLKFNDFYFCAKLSWIFNLKYTNKVFWGPKLKLFVLHDLSFQKSEGTDSNYEKFLKDFSPRISRKEPLLSQI